jgi:hypothetical protein
MLFVFSFYSLGQYYHTSLQIVQILDHSRFRHNKEPPLLCAVKIHLFDIF